MNIDDNNLKNKLDAAQKANIDTISCEEFSEFILDFLDDTLSLHQKTVFLKHLEECPACEKYLTYYRKTVKLSQTAFDDNTDEDSKAIPEELVQAILAASKINP